jgi:hypothetical protein
MTFLSLLQPAFLQEGGGGARVLAPDGRLFGPCTKLDYPHERVGGRHTDIGGYRRCWITTHLLRLYDGDIRCDSDGIEGEPHDRQ